MPVWHEGDRLGSEIEPLKGTTMALRTAIHRRALAGAIGRRSRGFARGALVAGVLAIALVTALAPELALAAEPTEVTFHAEERALSLSGDWGTAFWATIGGTLAMFALISIGYLYRRERGLDWDFQKPDVPHDTHH